MKVLGIDEAGRGPVLGPLVMVGFLIDEEKIPILETIGVDDSKKLTPQKREELFTQLQELGKAIIKFIEPVQIDAFNLNHLEKYAVKEIAKRAKADKIIIDAFEKKLAEKLNLKGEVIAEHKADAKYTVVGAASIVAKVLRDREIEKLQREYGDIGSGYPGDPKTKEFVKKLMKNKEPLPTFVRKSWGTIKQYQEEESQAKLGLFF